MSQVLDSKQIKQIGHEARKPLVSLINTAELLLAGLEGELSQQIQKDVIAIRANAEQSLHAVDKILALIRQQNT